MSLSAHDSREGRCRMLGHPVPFSYCRQVNGGLPCRLIADCWHEQFDVATFLSEHFTPEQLQAALAPPKPKLASILDLIEKARRPEQS